MLCHTTPSPDDTGNSANVVGLLRRGTCPPVPTCRHPWEELHFRLYKYIGKGTEERNRVALELDKRWASTWGHDAGLGEQRERNIEQSKLFRAESKLESYLEMLRIFKHCHFSCLKKPTFGTKYRTQFEVQCFLTAVFSRNKVHEWIARRAPNDEETCKNKKILCSCRGRTLVGWLALNGDDTHCIVSNLSPTNLS